MTVTVETLSQKRVRFTRGVALLIQKAAELGYGAALDQVKRTQVEANANANSGAGIAHSLHLDGLAADLNLYKPDGAYITDATGHAQLGSWWKSLGPDYYWGGDFTKRDYNHYSLSPNNGMTR